MALVRGAVGMRKCGPARLVGRGIIRAVGIPTSQEALVRQIQIKLPDGSVRQVAAGTTPAELLDTTGATTTTTSPPTTTTTTTAP